MSSNRHNISETDQASFSGRLLYVSASTYEGEWPSVGHSHPFSELFYVTGGHGSFVVEAEAFPVSSDELVIVNPNVVHTELSTPDDPLSYVVLGVSDLSFLFPAEADEAPPACRLYSFGGHGRQVRTLLNLLLEEASFQAEHYARITQSLLEVLLLLLQRTADFSLTSGPQIAASRECAHAQRYMDDHYHENITLESLAAMTHLNKYYFAHAFARYYGVSPIRYLTRRRIAVSQDLLSTSDYDVTDITRQLGFSSPSYFSQAFKRETGLSPAAYRRQYRQKGEGTL